MDGVIFLLFAAWFFWGLHQWDTDRPIREMRAKKEEAERQLREAREEAWRKEDRARVARDTAERARYNTPEAQAEREEAKDKRLEAIRAEITQKHNAAHQRRELHQFLKSGEWQRLRAEVLKRDSKKCANKFCQTDSKVVGLVYHVDHIKPKSLYPELMADLKNLQVLCEYCNIDKGTQDNAVWQRKQYSAYG